MPSIIGHVIGLSLQTELLIMTFAGLVTSIINWSHILWSQQVDHFLILEERIKCIHFLQFLYWVVIFQNVLTIFEVLGYILNFYPILTWSRPYFLLPWLYLRAIKAVYLKTLLALLVFILWMKETISLALFVEFIITELLLIVPIIYNWQTMYSFYKYLHLVKCQKRNDFMTEHFMGSQKKFKNKEEKKRSKSLLLISKTKSRQRIDSDSSFDTESRVQRVMDILNIMDKKVKKPQMKDKKEKFEKPSISREIAKEDSTINKNRNIVSNFTLKMCTCNSSSDSSDNELETIKDSELRYLDCSFGQMQMLPSVETDKKNPFSKETPTDHENRPTENEILCESCEREQNLFKYYNFDLSGRREAKLTKGISKSSKFFQSLNNYNFVHKAIPSDSSGKPIIFDKTWSLGESKVQLNLRFDKDQMDIFNPCSNQKFGFSCQLMRLLSNFISRPWITEEPGYSAQMSQLKMIECPEDIRSKKCSNLKMFNDQMEMMKHKLNGKKISSINKLTPKEEKKAMRALRMFNKMTLEQDKFEICQKTNLGEESWKKTILTYLHVNPINHLILNTDWNINDRTYNSVPNPYKTLLNFEKNCSWNERFEPDSSYVDPLILLQRAYTFSDDESDIINNNSFDSETKSEHLEEIFQGTITPEIDFSIMFDDINTFEDCDKLTGDEKSEDEKTEAVKSKEDTNEEEKLYGERNEKYQANNVLDKTVAPVFQTSQTLLQVINLVSQGVELKNASKDDQTVQEKLRAIFRSTESNHLRYIFDVYHSTFLHFDSTLNNSDSSLSEQNRRSSLSSASLCYKESTNCNESIQIVRCILDSLLLRVGEIEQVMFGSNAESDDSYASTFTVANHSEHSDSLGNSSLIEEFAVDVL